MSPEALAGEDVDTRSGGARLESALEEQRAEVVARLDAWRGP